MDTIATSRRNGRLIERRNKMKLILETLEHAETGFKVKVITCNKKIATTKNLETGETVKFNRGKLEWMIEKGIFKMVSPC